MARYNVCPTVKRMSEKQRRKVLNLSYISSGIKTDAQLKALCKYGLGINVIDQTNVPKHNAPFEALADAFFQRVTDQFWWASRGSGKSFMLGVLSWLFGNYLPGCDTRILGASAEQSGRVYNSTDRLWQKSGIKSAMVHGEPLMESTQWLNGSSLEILTASMKSVRGPHGQKLLCDECEIFDIDILKAAIGQPKSSGDIKAGLVCASTHHKVGGPVDYLLSRVANKAFKLYIWNIWNVLEPCVDMNCSTCIFERFRCPGKHMKQSQGFYTFSDFERQLRQSDTETVMVEWLCARPSRQGLVIPEFNEHIHIVDSRPYNPSMPTVIGGDPGFRDPYAMLVVQKYDNDYCVIDEIYETGKTAGKMKEIARERPWYKKSMDAVFDEMNPDEIEAMREDGSFDCRAAHITKDDGRKLVRVLLKPALGPPRLFICRNCQKTIAEFYSWSYKAAVRGGSHIEVPEDANDHAISALWRALSHFESTGVAPASADVDAEEMEQDSEEQSSIRGVGMFGGFRRSGGSMFSGMNRGSIFGNRQPKEPEER